jgi:hypothetical protein
MAEEILEMKRSLLDGITQYMKYGGATDASDPDYDPDFDAGYTQAHIDRCGQIIDTYLVALENVGGENVNERILEAVKVAVLDVNQLNDECDGGMIETDQREQLCALIIAAAAHAGLVSSEYDITEPWREW